MLSGMSSNHPPALRHQHNGWTPERQQRFLDQLALTGSVAAAARAAGMARQSAYWLRRQPAGAAFARAWDAAVADAGRQIEDLAMDRLLDGEEEVIERDGVVVAVRRRPCDVRLLLYHLKRLQDGRRGAGVYTGPDASDVSKLRDEIRRLAGVPAEDVSLGGASFLAADEVPQVG
jgi:hypothetical protein